ncbi:PQQ-dependent sugar dehydrogenase [Halocatena halophila]|uniref:PQQ-dependent sugar dehydrogenase n=1 Tax=Halocatena halophila TaxID=2814576 RepID=UPI002ED21AC2
MNRRTFCATVATMPVFGSVGCQTNEDDQPTPTDGTTDAPEITVETVVDELVVPWGVTVREGTIFVTERPGRIQRIENETATQVASLEDSTRTGGEGGLLGLVAHPNDGSVAYTYQTYETDTGRANRILQHDISDGWSWTVLFDGIPGGTIHDGGRLFIHDDALFVTTGDASNAGGAQNPDRLNGKILRLTLDGAPHPDNPFDNAVFTYGHRNPEGLTQRDGVLYTIEHGPDEDDEVNRLTAGGNYGWPERTGESDSEEFVDPVVTFSDIIAPGGGTFYDGPLGKWQGDLFLGTLAGEHLRRIRLDNDTIVENEPLYEGEFGRLRTPFMGPDQQLCVTTSNRDGRGNPNATDDKIIRLRANQS